MSLVNDSKAESLSKNKSNEKSSLLNTKVASAPAKPKKLKLKVTVPSLNRRSGPGYEHNVVGKIEDMGTYTYVEELIGWFKLDNNLGWVCGQYVEKI